MRVSFADAMIYWEMDGFISFASEVGKEKNSGLQRSIQVNRNYKRVIVPDILQQNILQKMLRAVA